MNPRRPAPIVRTHLLVGAAVACLAGWAWGGAGLLAALAGVALGGANLWAIRALAARAVAAAEAGTSGAAGWLVARLLLKMVGLFFLAWVAVRVLRLPVLPFGLGFSALVLALVFAGQGAFAAPEEAR